MRMSHLASFTLLASLAWINPARAAESYDNCTGFITSLPAVITTQGTWCMNADLATAMTSGQAISINTNNVTINCNDFKLGGLSAGLGTTTIGIYASSKLNITVRDCNIRGFRVGVLLTGSQGGGHAVEDSRFDGNTYEAIEVEGDGSVIRGNRISATGGGTAVINVYALNAYGGVDVLDNTVSGTFARSTSSGSTYGIWTFGNNASVRGNRVRGNVKDQTGVSIGMYHNNNGRMVVRDNEVLGFADVGSIGLLCASNNASAVNNSISGFATAISICTNDGGNVVKP